MWFSLVLALIVGATAVTNIDNDQQGAWKTGREYKYLLRSYTTTALGQPNKPLNNQISGFVINAIFTIQVRSPETLIVNFANVQYAQVHKVLPDGIESIPDDKLSYQKASLIGENFTIRLKDGVIEELEVDSQTPVWQVNLQKSIASQLQFDTRGKNEIPSEGAQISTTESPFGLYRVLEQSIGGNCEVQYDIAPLPGEELSNAELLPNPTFVQNNEQVIDIKKIKNYQNCKDLKIQSINIDKEIASGFVSRLSTTRTIVSGNLKRYTILSSVTTSTIDVSLGGSASLGTVVSKSKITLQGKREIRQPFVSVGEFTRIKDLTYSFKCATDPVALAERDPNRESVSSSSSEEKTSRENDKKTTVNDRTTSSEENPDFFKGSFINEQLPTKLDELPNIPTLFECAAKQFTAKQKVNKVRALIQEVIDDFVPSNKDFSVTPSKFLLVVKLMRTLDLELLEKLKQKIEEDNAESAKGIDPKMTALEVFYNALAQVGTGPALLLLKQGIQKNQLCDLHAARAISKLDTAVRLLTKEYVEAVCDMLEDPKITEEKPQKRVVLLVCGKILGRVARSDSKLISDSDRQELLSRYITIMGQKLRESIQNGHVLQAYALVLSLGNTGDPRILSVLEPYLEGTYVDSSTLHDKQFRYDGSEEIRSSETGKIQERGTLRSKRYSTSEEKNDKSEEKETIVAMNGNVTIEWVVRKPLRKLMVMMVGEVIRHNPSKYRSIALKLYLNPQESPEIRCIAVHSYIMSNPSLLGLMRVAKCVNVNKEVRPCVENSLTNAVKDDSLPTNLRTKAQLALKFLDPATVEGILNKVTEVLSKIFKKAISVISPLFYKVPSSAYLRTGLHHLHSDMQMTTTVAYDVSNLNVLIEHIMEQLMSSKEQEKSKNKPMQSQVFTQIMQELKIKPVNNKLEGFVYMEMFKSFLYSFGDPIMDANLKKLKEILLENNPYTFVDMNVYDRVLSFPDETGLQFVLTQEIPSVTAIYTVGEEAPDRSTLIRGKLNVIHSSKLQNTIAVATPCNHEQYVSGTDNTLVVVAPLTVDIKIKDEGEEKQLSATLSPSKKLSATDKVLLYSNTPYTSINNFLELKPILLSENTHPVRVPEKIRKNTIDLGLFRLTTETDIAFTTIQDFVDDLYNLRFLTNYNIAIQPKSDLGPKQEVTLTVVYATENIKKDDESSQKDGNPAQEDLETTPKDVPSLDKTPNSKLRRQEFLKRAKSVVKSANLQVVDVSLRIPASGDTLARDYVFTTILVNRVGNNNIHNRICAYFNRQTEDKNIELEVGLIGVRNLTFVRTENLNQAVQEPPEDKYYVNVVWEKQGDGENRFKVEAIQSQSASLRQAIQNSNAVQQCLKALNTGDTEIQACKESAALANKKDNFKVSVTYNSGIAKKLSKSTTLRRVVGYLYVLSPRYINTINIADPKYAGKNVVEMEVKAPLYAEQMDVTLYTPKADITLFTPKQSGQTLSHFFIPEYPICSVSKNELVSFDNVHRRVKLGKCWHAMSTAIVQPETTPLVLVKEDDGSNLLLTVVTSTGKEFKFRDIEGQFLVSLGTRPLASTSSTTSPSQDPVFDAENVLIYNAPNYLKLVTKDGNFEVVYYGKSVDVRISNKLLKHVAGLCGSIDQLLDADWRGEICNISSDEYAASFALLSQGCQGPTVFNKQKAVMSLAACSKRQNRLIDIINDREAGRDTGRDTTRRLPVVNPGVKPRRNSTVSKTEDELTETFVEYRTSYYENDASVCFSTVPVPQCSCGCTPEKTEERHYNFHCMPKISRTITLMNKIDKGARPDFSARSVSTTQSASYPTKCSCANPSTECENPQ